MVKLLIDRAQTCLHSAKATPPFTTARLARRDHICDLLVPFDDRSPVSGPKDLGTRKNCPAFDVKLPILKGNFDDTPSNRMAEHLRSIHPSIALPRGGPQ
jgi:hypothetical protein